MKKRIRTKESIPLADMHTDGVRFDPAVLAALKNNESAGAGREYFTKEGI